MQLRAACRLMPAPVPQWRQAVRITPTYAATSTRGRGSVAMSTPSRRPAVPHLQRECFRCAVTGPGVVSMICHLRMCAAAPSPTPGSRPGRRPVEHQRLSDVHGMSPLDTGMTASAARDGDRRVAARRLGDLQDRPTPAAGRLHADHRCRAVRPLDTSSGAVVTSALVRAGGAGAGARPRRGRRDRGDRQRRAAGARCRRGTAVGRDAGGRQPRHGGARPRHGHPGRLGAAGEVGGLPAATPFGSRGGEAQERGGGESRRPPPRVLRTGWPTR